MARDFEELTKTKMYSVQKIEFLKAHTSGQRDLMFGSEQDDCHIEYSDAAKQLALYRYCCSTKAYEYVRQHFKLPHVSTLDVCYQKSIAVLDLQQNHS